jgi:hypothetical protein
LDALPQYFFAGVEHDMEDIQSGVTQAGEYLLQVREDQYRLRGIMVLAGEAGQFGGKRATAAEPDTITPAPTATSKRLSIRAPFQLSSRGGIAMAD